MVEYLFTRIIEYIQTSIWGIVFMYKILFDKGLGSYYTYACDVFARGMCI